VYGEAVSAVGDALDEGGGGGLSFRGVQAKEEVDTGIAVSAVPRVRGRVETIEKGLQQGTGDYGGHGGVISLRLVNREVWRRRKINDLLFEEYGICKLQATMDEVETALREKYAWLRPSMNEATARLWAGAEAKALGRGGVAAVVRATGLSRTTVVGGMRDLDDAEQCHWPPQTARI
jgi:hypothetical protein